MVSNKKLVEDFLEYCEANVSQRRVYKYRYLLNNILDWSGKNSFHDMTRKDIVRLCKKIDDTYSSDWTRHDHRGAIKVFWRWLKKTEDYPKEVSWIRTTVKFKNKISREQILSEDEVYKIVKHAVNSRDRAFIALAYESGCRAGEILGLKVGDLNFDNMGVHFIVRNTKTGVDINKRIMNKEALKLLDRWLERHPNSKDMGAPLWVTLDGKKKFSYHSANKAFKKASARAGFGEWDFVKGDNGYRYRKFIQTEDSKKIISLHWLRHARVTNLRYERSVPDAVISKMIWGNENTKMWKIYSHGDRKAIDNALVKVYGVDKEKQIDDALSKVKVKDPELYDRLLNFVAKELKGG